MITRNTKNRPIKTPITGVVPQPGATFPYSEFRGFKAVPNAVTFPFVTVVLPFDVVAIKFFQINFILIHFSFASGIAEVSSQKPIVVVTSTAREAETLCDDLEIWLGKDRVRYFPAWETLPFERISPATETMGNRLEILHGIQTGRGPDVLVAPVRSLLQRINPEVRDVEVLELRRGDRADLSKLATSLVANGYRRELQVDHRGEFAVRGGLLDIFPATSAYPVRVDLWGDELGRLSEY